MRLIPAILVITALLLPLCGCASHRSCDDGQTATAAGAEHSPPASTVAAASMARPYARSLIFDREPGLYSASDFAGRSDWPSTYGYYRAPEIIYYRQHDFDIQGPGRNDNSSYRQFDTYRYGAAVR